MSDPAAPREPSFPPPHRVARTDQYLATASTQLDKLVADYATAVAEEGAVAAANVLALALLLGHQHRDVAWIATQAIRRLHDLQQQTADDDTKQQ